MAGETILVVDDDPIFRAVAGEMLRLDGFAVAEAEDGVVALRHMARAPADLVVLDMIMPEKEGIETLRELKAAWPRVPVVVVSAGTTAMGADLLLRMALYSGADATDIKPLRAGDFLPTVRRLLETRPSAVDVRDRARAALLRRAGR